MSSRILVTGGSGFLGCYVVKTLAERGDHVVNYDISPPGSELQWFLGEAMKETTFERGSIADLSEILIAIQRHKIEKIVHAAAIVDPHFLLSHPILAYRVNVGGTVNVLESARLQDISRVVWWGELPIKFISKP